MKQNFSEIVCIVDRSGSMSPIRDDAIGGFNTFLEDQKQLPGEAQLTLVLFDHEYLVIHNGVPLGHVAPLNKETFQPRGMTALLDAVGKTIDAVGQRLAQMAEAERPSKVIVAILTDGKENASQQYNHDQIADKIKHQEEKYSWEFFFLGANIDVKSVAKTMNIRADNALPFVATKAGIREANKTMSAMVGRARTQSKK